MSCFIHILLAWKKTDLNRFFFNHTLAKQFMFIDHVPSTWWYIQLNDTLRISRFSKSVYIGRSKTLGRRISLQSFLLLQMGTITEPNPGCHISILSAGKTAHCYKLFKITGRSKRNYFKSLPGVARKWDLYSEWMGWPQTSIAAVPKKKEASQEWLLIANALLSFK